MTLDGETMTDFIFLGSKTTAGGDCSHKIKRCLLLGRKAMTNIDSLLKKRDITLLTKGPSSQQLWCWRRLSRVPWTARRSNQSILRKSVLNIHWKDWCWSWNSNTLATWCEELTHLKKPLMLGKIEGRRRRERQRMRWLDGITNAMDMSLSRLRSWWWTGKPGVL